MSEPQKISSWDEIDAPQKVSSWDEVDNDVKKKDVTTPTPKPLQQNGLRSGLVSPLNLNGQSYYRAPLVAPIENTNLGIDVGSMVQKSVTPKTNTTDKVPLLSNQPQRQQVSAQNKSDNLNPAPSVQAQAQILGLKSQAELSADEQSKQLAEYLNVNGKDLSTFDPIEFKKALGRVNGEEERKHFIGADMHSYQSDVDAYNKVGSILERNIALAKADIDAKYGAGAFARYQKQKTSFGAELEGKLPQIDAIDAQLKELTERKPRTVQEFQANKQLLAQLEQQRKDIVAPLQQVQEQIQQAEQQTEFQKLKYLGEAQQGLTVKQQSLLDKYPSAKATLQSNEKLQSWIDNASKKLSTTAKAGGTGVGDVPLVLLGDALKTVTGLAHKLSSIPQTVEKAFGVQDNVFLTPFNFATGLINDATAIVDDKAKNLIPTNLQLPISQKYKLVDGNKIFLDKNDKPTFVRDADGYKVDPKQEQLVIEQYNQMPNKSKIKTEDNTDWGVALNDATKFGMDIVAMGQMGRGLSALGLAGTPAKTWANGTLTLMGYGLNDAYEGAKQSAPNLTDQQAAQYALGSQTAIGAIFGLLGGAKMKYITGEGGESVFSKMKDYLSKNNAFKLTVEDIKAIDGGASAFQVGKAKIQKAIGEGLLQGGEMGIIMPSITTVANNVTNTMVGYDALDGNLVIDKESLTNSALPAILVGIVTGGMSVNGSTLKNQAWGNINKNEQTVNSTIEFLDKSVEDGLYTPTQAYNIKERIKYTQENIKPLDGSLNAVEHKALSNLYDNKFQLQKQADKFTDSGAKKAYTDKIRDIDNDIAQIINKKEDFKSNITTSVMDNGVKENEVVKPVADVNIQHEEVKVNQVEVPLDVVDESVQKPASEMDEQQVNQLYEEKIANPTVEEEQNPFLDKLRKKKQNEAEITPNELVEQGGVENVGEGLQGEYQNNQGVQQGSGIGQVGGQEVPTEKVEEGINAIQESSKKESAFDIVAKEEEIARKKQQADKDKALLDIELIKSGDTETIDKYFKKSGYKEITGNETDTRLKGKKGVYKNTGASIIIKKSKTDAALDSAINISNKKIQGLSNSRIEEIVKEFQSKQPPISKTETTENPALKDVEATVKALEGVAMISPQKIIQTAKAIDKIEYVEEQEARDIIESYTHYKSGNQKSPATRWAGWFQSVNAANKKFIVDDIQNDPKLRNAMLSLFYDVYKAEFNFKGTFDDFLNTEITLYRGITLADKKGVGQEGFSAFSTTKNRVMPYADEQALGKGQIKEIKITPNDTYGAVNYIGGGEVEVLVPTDFKKETLKDDFNRLVELNIGLFNEEQLSYIEKLYDKEDYISGMAFAKSVISSNPKKISEAYHKAKADGSNPELVKAVEEALKPTPEVSKPVSEVAELKEKQQEKFLNEQKGENKQDNKGLFEQKTPTNKAESSAENKVKIKYGGEDKDLKGNPKSLWMLPTETSEQATKRIADFVEASDFKGRETSAYIDKKGKSIEVKLRNDDGKWNWYEPKSKKPFASFNSAKEAIKFIQEQPFWDNGELNKNGRNDAYFTKNKIEHIERELENGNIIKDIEDGKITAEEAKEIIEKAGLKVPKAVEDALTPQTENTKTNEEQPTNADNGKKAETVAEISPNKNVSASKASAIKDLIAEKYSDLKEMEAGILANLDGKEPIDDLMEYVDWNRTTQKGGKWKGKGLKGSAVEKLIEKGYVEEPSFMDENITLTDKGKKFQEALKARQETRKGIKAGTDLFPKDAGLKGKELVGDALDRIANKIGGKKNLTEQERTSLTKDISDLAKGLIQMGSATLDNVIDKIKEAIKKRVPELSDKEVDALAENIEDKVLLGEAVNWYKDKGYTYEQAKAELDKSNVDYNEQDLSDVFNGKTEPQELIGTKNAMTEQEMERMGITPPEKLKSKPYQEQIKVAREGIDNGTVDPYTIVDDILSTENIEDTAIKPSYEPALQLHLVDLKNKVNVANDRIIEIEKQLQKEPDNLELQGEISDLNAQIIQAETDREQALMAAQKAGTVWGNYGQNRQNVIDLQDIVQAKINRIRALYNGEPPKEVKEKLESLQRENDRLEAENRRITKEFNESQQQQDTAEFQKQLQQEYERGLVEGGNKASYQKRAKSIADSVRKLKTKPPVLKDANGNEIKITQNALFPTASWNDAVEILAKSIETAGTFADGLANGIEKVKKHLESYGWYSKLSDKDKESVVGLVKDSISAKDEQNKRLKIPRGYLKDIIESKGITDINKLVEEVKNDYPDKSDREIRDAITGYGVTSEPSSEPVDVALRKMNRKGRILSALEDLDEGIRPDRSGAKRDVLEDDERADLKKIRDGIKELPQSDEDLSKKMKSAQDAIETRIKNRIADIKLILDGKAKDTKSNKVEDTEDITKLRDEKEQWEQKLVDFKAKNKQSDALDAIQKLADKNGSTTVSKEMVTNGHIKDVITSQIQDGVPLKDIAENTVNLLKPILPDITQKDVTDALLKKGNFATEKTTKKDLQIQLSDLKAQLNLKEKIANLENGIIQKTKEKGATSDEVKELQKQLAETKQRAKNGFADISSAELERQIKATQNKIDKGEYFKIPVDKKTFENDKQWLENKKRLDDIKKKLNILEQNARESKKTTAMIIADVVTQNIGRRLVFFGSQAYQVKLSVAAFTTLLTKLPKEVLGQVFTTMFPKIGKDAQIEGSFDLGAVGKFYGEALNPLKLAKGTANIALTGKNTLDQTLETHPERQYTLAKLRDDYNADYAWYAKYPKIVASIMSSNHIPGLDLLTTDPHVMIKDPIKRGSYEFAFMKIMNHYKSLGMELNNPLLIGMAQDAAFRYAKAEIFMGSGLDKSGKRKDPSFTDKINAYFNGIENSAIDEANKKGGNQVSAHSKYALVKLYNFLYPVVGVPSRILGTVVKSNPISFSKDLMSAAIINRKVTKGIESLSNNQADMIIRQLKEGAIGSAMWTLGFVATMNMLKKQDEERKKNKLKLGGYYTGYIDKKDRIRENLLQPNDFIINNDGHDKYLTHNAQHSTAVMAIQAGATLATLFYHFNNPHLDYKAIETDGVKRYQRVIAQDDKASSVKKATVGLAGSLADQHPIVQTSYDIYESTQTDKGREAYIRNIKNRLDVKKKAQKLKDGILDLNFFEDTPGH